jgi:hypothetical protein
MRQPTPQREMLLPAKQGRHGVNIWDVRRDDKRRHRKPGFPLEPHLPNERAYKAMCEIIHNPAAGGMVSEWQYGVIAMLIFFSSDTNRIVS